MRLDKFLKVSRLIKRRTSAAKASDAGRVCVNGRTAKPSKQLNVNDIITITYADSTVKVQIIRMPEGAVSVQEASSLYKVIE